MPKDETFNRYPMYIYYELDAVHFSSIDSYSDPTHRWHLSSEWHSIMTDSYLQAQVSRFSHLKTKISFGKSALAFIPRFIIKLKGINWWEKKLAFVLRARNIETTLKVEKNRKSHFL